MFARRSLATLSLLGATVLVSLAGSSRSHAAGRSEAWAVREARLGRARHACSATKSARPATATPKIANVVGSPRRVTASPASTAGTESAE
jgi:hypothetical protein